MGDPAFGDWDGTPASARILQAELAKQVRLRDDFAVPLRTVAGFDVGFEDGGGTTRAAAVLLDADTLQVLDTQVVRMPTGMPYVPGLLSFRELPALLQALAALPQAPDLAFIDGHGIAHPRGLGIAAHFGVATGLPSIGVAKKILTGSGPAPRRPPDRLAAAQQAALQSAGGLAGAPRGDGVGRRPGDALRHPLPAAGTHPPGRPPGLAPRRALTAAARSVAPVQCARRTRRAMLVPSTRRSRP